MSCRENCMATMRQAFPQSPFFHVSHKAGVCQQRVAFGLVVSLFRPFCAPRQAPQDPGFRPLAPDSVVASARSTKGSVSGRSSTIRPGPKALAAAPCSQTAALVAANPLIPWASKPRTMPPSTSPVPAVASHGLVVALIDAFPSGEATTVSAPFKAMIAPDRAAAALARSSFGNGARSPNSRANSPSCGVRTTGAPRGAILANSAA